MGLLDRFFGTSEHDRFAKSFIAALKKAGDTRTSVYEAEEFRLVFSDDGEQLGVLNLGNMFAEYERVDPDDRQQCMSELVRAALSHLKEMPKDYSAASYDIRPRLWARATLEQIRLRAQMNGQAAPDWPLESIGDHLYLSLVYDLPESVRSIANQDLEQWGVTYWEAREVAIQNLEESEFVMASLGDELFASNTGDTYDATRMVLPDLIERLPIDGKPILMVPNRDTLLITGTDSEVGQKMMLEFATQQLEEQPRPMIATPLTLDAASEWVDWQPSPNNPVFADYKRLQTNWYAAEYNEQKHLLDSLNESQGVDRFVASYSVVEKDGVVSSYCVWSKGVDSLLPQTDTIALMDSPDGAAASVPFEIIMDKFGSLFLETDYYPKRYYVRDFPTEQQFAELLKDYRL